MAFAVLHIKKGTANGGALGNHVDREQGKEHSYRNADPEKRNLNFHVLQEPDGSLRKVTFDKHTPGSLESCVKSRISEGHTSTRKIRKDAVKHLQLILTSSKEGMKDITSKGELNKWVAENYKFVAKEFGGKENIIRFTVHMDERTPHIHAVVVPIADRRLCAKEFIGAPDKLRKLQDNYAEQMSGFGLIRGTPGSKATHTTIKEYYGRIESATRAVEDLPLSASLPDQVVPAVTVAVPPTVNFNPEAWAAKEENKLKELVAEREKIRKAAYDKNLQAIQNKALKAMDDLHKHKQHTGATWTQQKQAEKGLQSDIEKLKVEKVKLTVEKEFLTKGNDETKTQQRGIGR